MSRFKFLGSTLFAFLLLIPFLTVCSGHAASSSPQAPLKDEVVYSSWMAATNLDPQKATSNEQSEIRPIYSALLDTEPGNQEIKPDLAERYEVSGNGKTYTFHLRKGVKFQKGFGDVKASDVLFTFARLRDPKTASRYARDFTLVESITAPDEYTVVFTLKTPFAPFPYLLSASYMGAYILSEKAVKQFGDDYGKNPIGSGPYQLEQWMPQNRVVYSANAQYFKGPPKIKKLTYLEIPDSTTAFMAFQKGEIDAMMIQAPEIMEQAKARPNTEIQKVPNFTTYNLFMNTKMKPFDDVRVRQAVNYAINKDELVKTVFGDVNSVAKGYVPSIAKGFTMDGVQQYPYDPEKAKQLLAAAGYPNGFTIETKQSNDTSRQRVFTVLQAQLAKVGIKLNFQAVSIAEWVNFQYSGNAAFGLWPFVTPPEIHFTFASSYSSAAIPPPSGANGACYSGVDEQINKAVGETSWNVRAQLYKQAQQKLSQDVPTIPLYESNAVVISNNRLKGVVPGGAYAGDIRFENARWE